MPLEPGKSQKVISHNIAVERHHGKPEKQAIAIAESNARRTGDREKDKRRCGLCGKLLPNGHPFTNCAACSRRLANGESGGSIMAGKKAKDDLQPVGAEDPERAVALKKHEKGLTQSQDRKRSRDGATGTCLQCKMEPPKNGEHFCSNECERGWMYKHYPEDMARLEGKAKDMTRARDIQGSEIREKLGISEAEWAKLDKSARQDKAREALRRAKDEVMPVGDKLTEEEKVGRRQYSLATSEARRKAAKEKKEEGKKAKDTELPTAVKTSNLVPMPSGEHNEASYAPRRIAARDRGRFKKVGDSKELREHIERLKKEPQSAMRDRLIKTAELAIKKGIPRDEAAREIARATDAKAILPLQTSGSEPADHMQRANEYEVAGDRARALDSYRAAASGYRKANDRANEAKARDGVEACQTKFAQQYDHPGRGRVKVCDSAESALRTAVERTRAGESVSVIGRTVKPGRARVGDAEDHKFKRTTNPFATEAKWEKCQICGKKEEEHKSSAKDAHEGFKKLEGKLSHEKGVTNPAALAASIGRKKYGEKGMEAKSAAGKAKDKEEFPHKANCPANNGDACRCGATNAAIEKLRGKATDSRREVRPV